MEKHHYEIIILSRCYKPGTAPTNRLLSFLKGFDELGIKVKVIFAYQDNSLSVVEEQYENIEFEYLWKDDKPSGKIKKYVKSLFRIWRISYKLPKKSNVFLVDEQTYLPILTHNNRLKVFHERTENPELINRLPFGLQKIYYNACKKTQCIFGISTSLCDFFKGIGCKSTAVINMTVDANRFKDVKKDSSLEKYIAYCGTVSNDKDGVNILLKAFAKISDSHPDVKLYIIGKFPKEDEYNSNVELIKSLGIENKVVLTGYVSYQDMPQILSNATVLALARPDGIQAQYGFPTKLGEYLLTANPVVITTVGDIPRFLSHKKSAMLCEPGSISDFADNLSWVLDHPDEAKKIGMAGKEVALKEFNYLHEAEKIYKIISSSK